MKKLISIVTIFAISLFAANSLYAQTELTKKQTKAIEKDVKKRAKELKKGGWEPLASLSTMETCMQKYLTYLAQDEENRIAITGIAIGKNNKIGRSNAVHSGITEYASRARAQAIGKIKSIVKADNLDDRVEEIDRFGAAYEQAVNERMQSLVKEHFALVRNLANGTKEYNVFMSIDESEAKEMREEAAREAAEKTSLKDLSEMTKEFIGEPVEME